MPKRPEPTEAKSRVYVASPLFSDAEKAFNRLVKATLEQSLSVYLPQEDGNLLVEMVARGAPPGNAGRAIFQCDVEAIRACDILLIVLDGRSVDEGAAFELGFAYALGKACYGLQTDSRRLLPYGNNPMIQNAIIQVFGTLGELDDWAQRLAQPGARANA